MKNSIGFITLITRECYRFLRLIRQTVAPPIITTCLFILIFGYSLGSRISTIEGVSYILFILPGLTAMGVINNAYSNTSTSLFMARMDRSIENMLSCPLSNLQLVSSIVIGGLLRGMLIGLVTLAISIPLVKLHVASWGLTILVLFLSSVLFSSVGILSALWSEGWDQIATFTNFIIMPFIYLGGVFYSVKMLPPFWQKVSLFNPIFYLVDSLRFAILAKSDVPWILSIGILSLMTLLTFSLCVYLFRVGYKLMS